VSIAERLGRLLPSAGSLRPSPRSTSLVSIANSLGVIASALKLIVAKEYGVDLDAPPLTRADHTREVFDPIYPDNAVEAIREEVERLQQMEAEMVAGAAAGSGAGGGGRGLMRSVRLGGLTPPVRSGDDDELSPQEREFMASADWEEELRG
jgi:hypothetical protein